MGSLDKQMNSAMQVGQTDLDGWMNAPCKIMGIHKVRAPWWIREEEKIDDVEN